MQIPGPTIIAQALPLFHQLILGGFSQRLHIREALHETVVILQPLGHTGLLKDHFGDPDPIGIRAPAPRQITMVGVIPLNQDLTDL